MSETMVLNGTQKAAIVLMQMSPENAVKVMAQFSESEAESLAAEIVRLNSVQPEVSESVVAEFFDIAVNGRRHLRGGRELAAGLLEASFGADRAAGLMGRLASTMAGKSFEFLEAVDMTHLATILDGELPETVALVLAHLRPDRASEVMAGLTEVQSVEVAHALATMGPATPETATIVAENLRNRIGAPNEAGPRQHEVVGGVQPLVDIINRADVTTERVVLDGLAEFDPELAEEVRSRLLSFGDIVRFARKDVQLILRGVDHAVLARAMKGVPQPVVEVINSNISDRNRDLLTSEIEAIGPVRASEVAEARAEIVRSIRGLDEAGEITIRRGEEEEFVY